MEYVFLRTCEKSEKNPILFELDSGELYEVADDILEFLVKYGLRKEL